MNKDLTLKRQLGYIEELKRCANEDCDFYLEHNEAYEFYNYIKDLQNNWNELKSWLKEQYKLNDLMYYSDRPVTNPKKVRIEYISKREELKEVLNKMQELEW